MKRSIFLAAGLLLLNLTASRVFAQTTQDTTKKTTQDTAKAATPAVEGASDVVGALASNADYSNALIAVKAAKLDSVLKTGGPYTIFAPHNNSLTTAKLDSLQKDPAKLASILKGHVVTGKYGKKEIIAALKAGKGKAAVTTLDGQILTLSLAGSKLQITNAAGSSAQVTLFDLIGANGIVDGINGVLLTK
jgi:uncharacterized surface protein with fasciclin (FAS1) repeats